MSYTTSRRKTREAHMDITVSTEVTAHEQDHGKDACKSFVISDLRSQALSRAPEPRCVQRQTNKQEQHTSHDATTKTLKEKQNDNQ